MNKSNYEDNNIKSKIKVVKGDITKLKVDAIVNAANKYLLGGGGVDGAIHNAAGPKLLDECRTLNGCNTGEAKITKAYNLPCNMVIHTVGPIYNGGSNNEKELLRSCYINSINLGVENNAKTIAFPAISTGVYGYPYNEACEIAFKAVIDMLKTYNRELDIIYFVCFGDKIYNKYNQLLNQLI